RARAERLSGNDALRQTAAGFAILYLRPALTLIALVSLAARPAYPYGFTLPVALGQDWGLAQDAAVLGVLAVTLCPRVRLPAPAASSLAFVAFIAYALLTPEAARQWEGHPGNEPKTLRMAVAIGHGLTLDVEGVSAGMEALTPRPMGEAARDAVVGLARESVRLLAAAAHGPRALGASAIRATRITRQTVRGKDGGVFYVLAPGPSFLLAPLLRLDRELNLARETPGRLTVTVLAWNALAAALVAAVFLLARDAGAGARVAGVVTAATALLPPFLFYSYQFYPEMLGALVLALALRAIVLRPWPGPWPAFRVGLLLATLPWLHQKFLPVWAILVAMALVRLVDELATLGTVTALLAPQALGAVLFLLYNFAITGSARPDALFLAWGPAGVSTARWGQGLFGLALDARYGLLPYVPVYLLALGGLLLPGPAVRRLRWAAPPVIVYYLTVAAADNWSGAVCSLGRYILPALPYALALMALVLAAAVAARRPAVLAVFLVLTTGSAFVAVRLWDDPHAANDCALLLARSAIGDGNVYVPNLFIRTWADAAPGLWARVSVWSLAAVLLAAWVRRGARGRGGQRPVAAVLALAAAVIAGGIVLEHWPSARTSPRYSDAIEMAPGVTAFVGADAAGTRALLTAGAVHVLVRSRTPLDALRVRFEGEGRVRPAGGTPLLIGAGGLEVDLPLHGADPLVGRRGVTEVLAQADLHIEGDGPIVLRAPGLAAERPVARVDE
ncbi:MAG TPA: hypothetical protein VGQ33_11215, partial [Vicinamibacteria bacterium]|nr:hypothetical protein [Vicinamibacteria bacterium]